MEPALKCEGKRPNVHEAKRPTEGVTTGMQSTLPSHTCRDSSNRKTGSSSSWKGCAESGSLTRGWWEREMLRLPWDRCLVTPRIAKHQEPWRPGAPAPGKTPKGLDAGPGADARTWTLTAARMTVAKRWKQSRSLPTGEHIDHVWSAHQTESCSGIRGNAVLTTRKGQRQEADGWCGGAGATAGGRGASFWGCQRPGTRRRGRGTEYTQTCTWTWPQR